MKKIFTIHLIVAAFIMAGLNVQAQVDQDTISMSNGYTTDIFYSLENGTVSTVDRQNWDIAFYTQQFSAGIMINDGSTHLLYTYPKGDTNAWNSVDTSGLSTWAPQYNSELVWEDGAFNRNAKGHPDYGWGWYNMANHHVYGDSIYIISIPEGDTKRIWKKIWIKEKKSLDNIYLFTYADLDGSNEMDVELDVNPYTSKRFIYYSLTDNMAVDREPESDKWDILFTKYIDDGNPDEEGFSPYGVTGATANVDIGINRFYPVKPDFNDWYAMPFDSTKNRIGWDWKEFDLESFSWLVLDSNFYFVQTYSGDVYKLWFTMWEGTMTGKLALAKQVASLAAIEDHAKEEAELTLYPNPASSVFSMKMNENLTGTVTVSIVDFTGRLVFLEEYLSSELQAGVSFNNLDLTKGMYVVSVKGDGYQTSQKLIIR